MGLARVSYVVQLGPCVVAVEPMLISADINSLYSLRSLKYRCGSFQSQVEPQKTPPAMAPIGGNRRMLPAFFLPVYPAAGPLGRLAPPTVGLWTKMFEV